MMLRMGARVMQLPLCATVNTQNWNVLPGLTFGRQNTKLIPPGQLTEKEQSWVGRGQWGSLACSKLTLSRDLLLRALVPRYLGGW